MNNGSRASKATNKRYQKQKARGTDGYGYITINAAGYVEHLERATNEKDILEKLTKETASSILFHHRTPTSTKNYIEATHPFKISDPKHKHDYYVIHNGVIQNWETLYEEYKKAGYVFMSEMHTSKKISFPYQGSEWDQDTEIKINDSEALSVDLARYFEGLQEGIKSRGSISFVALQCEKVTGKVLYVIYGHNSGNPLKIEQDDTLFCLRSLNGKSAEIKTDEIYYLNWETKEIMTEVKDIGSYYTRTVHPMNHKPVVKVGTDDSELYRAMLPEGKRTERMLDPTHPVLDLENMPTPHTGDMAAALNDMTNAYERAIENDDAHDHKMGFTSGRSGKDDERDSTPKGHYDKQDQWVNDTSFDESEALASQYGPDDDVDYREADFRDELEEMRADLETTRAILKNGDNLDDYEADQLRKELRKELFEAESAAAQLESNRDFIKQIAEAYKKGQVRIEDLEEASAMLHASEVHLKECMKVVHATEAELSTY